MSALLNTIWNFMCVLKLFCLIIFDNFLSFLRHFAILTILTSIMTDCPEKFQKWSGKGPDLA